MNKLISIHSYIQNVLTGKTKLPVIKIGIILAILYSLIPTYHILKFSFTKIEQLPDTVYSFLDKHIPQEVEITIKDGNLSTNQPEPFYITVNEQELTNFTKIFTDEPTSSPQAQSQMRVVTIDTKAQPDDFEKYQTLYLVTQKNIIYQDKDGIRLRSFAESKDFTITSDVVKDKISFLKSANFLFWLKIIAHILPIFVLIGALIGIFISWLGSALLFWAISYMMAVKVPFSRLYAVSAALWCVPSVLSYLCQQVIPGELTTITIDIIQTLWKIGIAIYIYQSFTKLEKI